jgi:uncharacterized protein (DUF1778 family)
MAYIFAVPATVKQQKRERFAARLTTVDKQLFKLAAAIEGRTLAKFVIYHTAAAARQIVARNSRFQLDASQSRQFVEALLAPSRPPSSTLKQALVKYKELVTED